jgi:hypothetical protein
MQEQEEEKSTLKNYFLHDKLTNRAKTLVVLITEVCSHLLLIEIILIVSTVCLECRAQLWCRVKMSLKRFYTG